MQYGYARVSTVQQDLSLQRAAFKKAGIKRVIEEKRSGGGVARPLLDALLQKLQAGDLLVVYKIDRLARSLSDLLRILRRVREVGAFFRSLTEPLETQTPAGELLLHMLGAFAQFERAMIRDRCMAGRAAAVERGVRFGRPPRVDAAEVRRLRGLGLVWREVAARLGITEGTAIRAGFGQRVCDGAPPIKKRSSWPDALR